MYTQRKASRIYNNKMSLRSGRCKPLYLIVYHTISLHSCEERPVAGATAAPPQLWTTQRLS